MSEQTRIGDVEELAKVPKIMPDAEPFFFPAGETGCLLIHGFNSSPDVLRQMGWHLAEKGITALGVRLEGHGTDIAEMDHCSYHDWVASAEAGLGELRRRCRAVFVAGISMGGVISLHLARLHPDRITGVIAMCAPYDVPVWMKILVPPLKRVRLKLPFNRRGIRDPEVVKVGYRQISLPSVHQMSKLTALARAGLPLVACPVLLIASRLDSIVNAKNAQRILSALGSADKELFWVERSDHSITIDYDKELVFQRAADFIKAKTPELSS